MSDEENGLNDMFGEDRQIDEMEIMEDDENEKHFENNGEHVYQPSDNESSKPKKSPRNNKKSIKKNKDDKSDGDGKTKRKTSGESSKTPKKHGSKSKYSKDKKKSSDSKAIVLAPGLIFNNPYHYQNYLKIFILCNLARFHYLTKLTKAKLLLPLIISKLPYPDVQELDRIKDRYTNDSNEHMIPISPDTLYFKEIIIDIFKILNRNFAYKRFNENVLMTNLANGNSFTIEQYLQIFQCLCEYVGITSRMVFSVDLSSVAVDKKHQLKIDYLKKATGVTTKKRKADEITPTPLEKKLSKLSTEKVNKFVGSHLKQSAPRTKKVKLTKDMIENFSFDVKSDGDERSETSDIDNNDDTTRNTASSNSNGSGDNATLTKREKVALEFDNKMAAFKLNKKAAPPLTTKKSVELIEPPKIESFKAKPKLKAKSKTLEEHKMVRTEPKKIVKKQATESEMDEFSFNRKGGKIDSNGDKYLSDDCDSTLIKFWVEVHDDRSQIWHYTDPLRRIVDEEKKEIDRKIHNTPSLFILAFQKYDFNADGYKTSIPRLNHLYLKDLTSRYVSKWHKLLLSRRQLGLEAWWNQIKTFFQFHPLISSEKWRQINKTETELLCELEKKDIPENYKEFSCSKYYILPSQLKKYQGIHPDARPLDIKSKDEVIYDKSAICALHSKSRWQREMRKVKKGEQSVKKVISILGNNDTLVDLYGFWQTEPYDTSIQQDGSLPRNDYGNFELFNGIIPEGTVHIELPGLPKICKKLGLEFVETVVGFEKSKTGHSHIIKGGILAHKRDHDAIVEAFEKYKDEIMKKEAEKAKKEVLKLWKGIFRKILVKKYVSDAYRH
jgi:xeroderma pigmentosum group C-complementing protein